jgi:hypothetical protein
MIKIKFVAIVLLLVTLGALPVLAGCTGPSGTPCSNYTILIGGSFPLTLAYPEDGYAVMDAYQDYAQWVNANHCLSPWDTADTLPSNITLVVVGAPAGQDDTGAGPNAVTLAKGFYATDKAAGLKVWRISGSGIGGAMKGQLFGDQCGAVSQASGAWAETGGSGSIFLIYPLYTEQMAAVADWFITGNSSINPNGWNVTHPADENYTKPRVAYLTNNTFGTTGSLIVASLNNYLTSIGYNVVDTTPHYVTSGASAAWDAGVALTSLQWCQNNTIDLTLGAMTCPPAENMMNLANSLGIGAAGSGHNANWTMQIALSSPAHGVIVERDATYTWLDSHLADGLVVAGSYPAWYDNVTNPGVAFAELLQNTYRPGQGVTYNATAYALSHVMYQHGLIEAMIQVDAIRLALLNTSKSPCDLTISDVFTQGFLKINGLDSGGIIPGLVNYSTGSVEGAQYVRVDLCANGTTINLGTHFALHPNLY